MIEFRFVLEKLGAALIKAAKEAIDQIDKRHYLAAIFHDQNDFPLTYRYDAVCCGETARVELIMDEHNQVHWVAEAPAPAAEFKRVEENQNAAAEDAAAAAGANPKGKKARKTQKANKSKKANPTSEDMDESTV